MQLPQGFVYLKDVAPTILQDVMYASHDNFMGRPARGYGNPVIICTLDAAQALKRAQEEVVSLGYTLKVKDAYRPRRAVEHFWEWAHDEKDTLMKEKFYPSFKNKLDLFNGYIAKLSGHSRGSAIDLTIATRDGVELDMGTILDFLGEESHTDYPHISEEAKANRRLLLKAMERQGFENYTKEWWHYSLKNEPFPRKPEDHFDFEVA